MNENLNLICECDQTLEVRTKAQGKLSMSLPRAILCVIHGQVHLQISLRLPCLLPSKSYSIRLHSLPDAHPFCPLQQLTSASFTAGTHVWQHGRLSSSHGGLCIVSSGVVVVSLV